LLTGKRQIYRLLLAAMSLAEPAGAQTPAVTPNANEACDSLSSPAPDIASLLRLADCLERNGKTASAYLALQDAVELRKRLGDTGWDAAEYRRAALQPQLSYITISVATNALVPSLTIERDGFALGTSSWALPLPTDPGHHRIRASAPGYQPWELSINLAGDGAVSEVEVPRLVEEPAAVPAPAPAAVSLPTPVPAPAPKALAPAPKPAVAPAEPAKRQPDAKLPGLLVGGAGVVALVASIEYFALVSSKLDERNAICPSGKDCEPGTNARLHALTESAARSQVGGIVSMGLGVAALAVGLGLFLSTPHDSGNGYVALRVTPIVGPASGGLLLQGAL
jgi:hypothetical protein